MNRSEALSDLKKNPEVSVLIIGGGINGRRAVILLERWMFVVERDFARRAAPRHTWRMADSLS
jgi:hypothetical protein